MGEMADLDHDRMWTDEPDPLDEEAAYLFEVHDGRPDELVRLTALARDEKVKGIRRYWVEHQKLSERQKWCLCYWIARHDES